MANIAFFNNSISSAGNTLSLRSLVTTTDNTILLIGANDTTIKNRVTRLTSSGALDTTFNGLGYNEFSIGNNATSASLRNAAISNDGRLFLAGFQINNGITTPYISSMYNNLSSFQVNQWPTTQAQGMQDASFGVNDVYPGVVSPYDGLYGVMLMQRARSVIELGSRNLLIGMDGFLPTSGNSNMMLARLNTEGLMDGSFGGDGKIALPLRQTNEYMNALLEDGFSNIYVAGYSNAGAIIRQYNGQGIEQWVGDILTSGYKGNGLFLQNSNRILGKIKF